MDDSFWYFATPYDKFPLDRIAGYNAAISSIPVLIAASVKVYSPIVHNHPIDQLLSRSSEFWLAFDEPFMRASCGLIVCKLATWRESNGIAHEIRRFEQMKKPVTYMEPGKLPVMIN